MNLGHLIEYLLFEFVGFIVRKIPTQYFPKLAKGVIIIASPILHSRKQVAIKNLRNAFPEKTEHELNRIASEALVNVAITFLEFLCFPQLSKEQLNQIVTIDNPELLSPTSIGKQGVIFMTAHFGNWELAAQSIVVSVNVPSYIIVKTQSNRLVDNKITRWRTQYGAKIIPMGIAIREIIHALHDGEAIFLAADQTAPKESISVEFFGRAVPTFQGPAVFSLKSGAPIILIMAVRQQDGKYRMIAEKVPNQDLGEYSEANVLELTRRQVKMTEEIIRKYPEQWMWMHKRWKHVPDRLGLP